MTRDTKASTPPGAQARRRVQRSASDQEAWSWAQTHRGRPPIAPPKSAGRAASKLIKPLSARFGPGAGELQARWPEIVGAPLAAHSTPVKFETGPGGLTLLIHAPGPAAALIEAQSAQILDRVARFSGRAPKRLKVTQAARRPRQPSRTNLAPRIRQVAAFTAAPDGLDAVMAAFEAAVFEPRANRWPGPTKK